jgi:membrane-associated protein
MTFLLDAFNWTQLLQPQFYIDNGGLWLVLLIIFAETGLFAGFFLPGDSLLFVSGIYSTSLAASFYDTGNDLMNLIMIIALTSLAGILGNAVGFWFGRRIGPAMYTWRDRLLFKQRYLHQAKEFYDKHGGGAIVFARFLPVIRTFAPIIAGIVYMDRKKFAFFNIVGSIAWTASMLAGGHYLQKFFEANFNYDLKEHLEVIVLGIVLLTTAPVLYKLFFNKKKDPAEPLNSSE